MTDEIDTKTIHTLKIHPSNFHKIQLGLKRHEVRVADRDYKEGDTVILKEYNPGKDEYSGKTIIAKITNITKPGRYGLPPHMCVFTIAPIVDGVYEVPNPMVI